VGATPPPALEALERIRSAVAARDWSQAAGVKAPGVMVTMSAGIAGFRKGETAEQLINRADAALYDAKRAGRNRIEVSQT
jgi:diguanylate cyclase (GGDEF)-like protein